MLEVFSSTFFLITFPQLMKYCCICATEGDNYPLKSIRKIFLQYQKSSPILLAGRQGRISIRALFHWSSFSLIEDYNKNPSPATVVFNMRFGSTSHILPLIMEDLAKGVIGNLSHFNHFLGLQKSVTRANLSLPLTFQVLGHPQDIPDPHGKVLPVFFSKE